MKKIIKLLTIIMPVIMIISLITGCTNITTSKSEKVYFQRGVYKSYPADNSYIDFYIFYDETSGHTEDSEKGIGLPFSCIQTNKDVKFKFGGSEEPEEIFEIKSIKDNILTGSFDDGKLLTFEPVTNADPDNFDALKYMKENKIKEAKSIDEIVEPIYTQDCFPRTLQNSGVSLKCFEHANLGQNSFCTESQLKAIKEYYQKGQDKDPLNNGSGRFCAN